MKQRNFTLPTLLAIALAACQQSATDENIAIDEVNNAAVSGDVESLPPSEASGAPLELDSGSDPNIVGGLNEADDAGSELPSPPDTPESRMIPDQYRGRWGLVAADCDQGRSDAKGAITIGEKSIRFYESTATLKERRPAIATSFSGLFGFTGEGQTWEKVMTFTRSGATLTRAENEGTFTYKRC
jgi:hypothetical protein